MKFDVFVQDSFYKTVEINTKNVADVLSVVGKDISDGLLSNGTVKIVPVIENKSQTHSNGAVVYKDDGTVQKLYKK